MKHLLIAAVIFFSLCGFSNADVIGQNNKEVQMIAEPILDNILDGFAQNDYVTYVKHFDATLKEAVSEKKFLETDQYFESSIGEYQSKEYLGHFKKGDMSVVLWKARYSKSLDDVLIKLVVSKRGGKYLVTGLWYE